MSSLSNYFPKCFHVLLFGFGSVVRGCNAEPKSDLHGRCCGRGSIP